MNWNYKTLKKLFQVREGTSQRKRWRRASRDDQHLDLVMLWIRTRSQKKKICDLKKRRIQVAKKTEYFGKEIQDFRISRYSPQEIEFYIPLKYNFALSQLSDESDKESITNKLPLCKPYSYSARFKRWITGSKKVEKSDQNIDHIDLKNVQGIAKSQHHSQAALVNNSSQLK